MCIKPAHYCFQNDLVVMVGQTRVSTCKQAAKLMKQGPEKFSVRIERATSTNKQDSDMRYEEDTVSLKVSKE